MHECIYLEAILVNVIQVGALEFGQHLVMNGGRLVKHPG